VFRFICAKPKASTNYNNEEILNEDWRGQIQSKRPQFHSLAPPMAPSTTTRQIATSKNRFTEKVNNLEYGLLESLHCLSRRFNLENRLGTSQLVESYQQPINGNLSTVKSLKTGFSSQNWVFSNLLRST